MSVWEIAKKFKSFERIMREEVCLRGKKKLGITGHMLKGMYVCYHIQMDFFFFKILFLFRERGKREKERERNIDVREKHQLVATCRPQTGDPAHNPGIGPDHKLNQQPFRPQAGTQFTEPHQPGPD